VLSAIHFLATILYNECPSLLSHVSPGLIARDSLRIVQNFYLHIKLSLKIVVGGTEIHI
jgi:hypothetical protein